MRLISILFWNGNWVTGLWSAIHGIIRACTPNPAAKMSSSQLHNDLMVTAPCSLLTLEMSKKKRVHQFSRIRHIKIECLYMLIAFICSCNVYPLGEEHFAPLPIFLFASVPIKTALIAVWALQSRFICTMATEIYFFSDLTLHNVHIKHHHSEYNEDIYYDEKHHGSFHWDCVKEVHHTLSPSTIHNIYIYIYIYNTYMHIQYIIYTLTYT